MFARFLVRDDGAVFSFLRRLNAAISVLGALIAGDCADMIGRRPTIIAGCAIYLVGVIVQMFANKALVPIVIGRIVAGLGVGFVSDKFLSILCRRKLVPYPRPPDFEPLSSSTCRNLSPKDSRSLGFRLPVCHPTLAAAPAGISNMNFSAKQRKGLASILLARRHMRRWSCSAEDDNARSTTKEKSRPCVVTERRTALLHVNCTLKINPCLTPLLQHSAMRIRGTYHETFFSQFALCSNALHARPPALPIPTRWLPSTLLCALQTRRHPSKVTRRWQIRRIAASSAACCCSLFASFEAL
jgi:hypothetical protein